MSLTYFARYRFNGDDVGREDFQLRDLALESGTAALQTDDGSFGKCISFDGVTSFLSTGTFANIAEDSSRTFTFWAKTNSTFANPVLSYGELTSGNAFVLYAANSDGHPEFYDYRTRYTVTSIYIPSTGEWKFFGFRYEQESGNLQVYVDGVLLETFRILSNSNSNSNSDHDLNLNTGTTDPLRVGTDGLGEFYNGNILDLRIWESALDASVMRYMFSVGPNYEEELGTMYAGESTRTAAVMGNLLCRTTYGIQDKRDTHTTSFYGIGDNSELQEVARVEHCLDDEGGGVGVDIGSQTIKVRDTNNLLQDTIRITPTRTTFTSTNAENDEKYSIVFSAQGVHLLSGGERGCLYFGAGRDFRIRVSDESFFVEAYSESQDSYQVKMQIDAN